MGQKITNEGPCDYCGSEKKGIYYKGLYPQDEELQEIHCNTCGASWDPDGTPRAIPSESKLEALGILQSVINKGLPISKETNGEWARNIN